ncbi:hypothetical protein D0862_08992 [Hortaea werneckii]|uniref:tRNA-splicing endonuclease subunit Sen15 domain-containing protein n=1 Tax=Hortaea werneckii TaxID=91943 RepID=A0A3M7G143_HORWE|nr:hypothetical protein D0862_08992 [Hortaea werneckii]
MNPSPPNASPASKPQDFSFSSLQQFIADSAGKKSPRSNSGTPERSESQNLALQVAHNLRFQHEWTDIRMHFRASDRTTASSLPRPMISGMPPRRLYVHPDEQIEVLRKQREQGKAGWPDLASEREWVLPTQLKETWTLRRFAEVFDALAVVPAEGEGGAVFSNGTPKADVPAHGSDGDGAEGEMSKWRKTQPKRLLLATVDDDSTVVYYIIHDGIVKPRQN